MTTLQEKYIEVEDQLRQFKDSRAWQIIKEFTEENIRDIDCQWHLYDEDSKEYKELKLRKRSLTYMLNIEKMLELNKDDLEKKIKATDSKHKAIVKDYDTETKIDKDDRASSNNYGV